jgi:hypothetical protein
MKTTMVLLAPALSVCLAFGCNNSGLDQRNDSINHHGGGPDMGTIPFDAGGGNGDVDLGDGTGGVDLGDGTGCNGGADLGTVYPIDFGNEYPSDMGTIYPADLSPVDPIDFGNDEPTDLGNGGGPADLAHRHRP